MKKPIICLIIALSLLALPGCVINLGDSGTEKTSKAESNSIDKIHIEAKDSEELNNLMAGYWSGSYQLDSDTEVSFESARFSNGEFEAHFRVQHSDGSESLLLKTGEWGVSGTIYSTITKEIMSPDKPEPMLVRNMDSFQITYFDGQRMEYCHIHEETCFEAVRPENFTATQPDEDINYSETKELQI